MPDFDNISPNTTAFVDDNNDVQDLQDVLESGAVMVTAVMAGSVTPIGTSTAPKFENIAPWAGKLVNQSDDIVDLLDLLTSGAIQVQVIGGGGGGNLATYITQTDETATLVNSIPMNVLATGFMTSVNTVGIAVSRVMTGTSNQVSIANGDGSANPAFSLSSTLVLPGTMTLGGDVDTLTHTISSSTSSLNLSSASSVEINSPWTSVQGIRRRTEPGNHILFNAAEQQFLPNNALQAQFDSNGMKLSAGATVNEISANSAATTDSLLMTALAIQNAISSSIGASTPVISEGYFNGLVVEVASIIVSSDGATVSLSIEQEGTGDLTILYSTGPFLFDSTPIVSISLTPGTDSNPIENYIFIPISTKVLTVSTVSFPTGEEYAAIARVFCQSASSVQVDGVYKMHFWEDHVANDNLTGHAQHLNTWIRNQNATWQTGVLLSPVTGIMLFDIISTSGMVLQLHPHDFPAFNTSTGSHVYVPNDSVSAYARVTDLTAILTDSAGGSLTGRRFNLVVWGSVSEDSGDCQLFINLPNGSYNSDSAAIDDSLKTSSYSIPTDFTGTGFLIARLTVRHQVAAGGTWSILNQEDLRSLTPSTAAGSGVSGADINATYVTKNDETDILPNSISLAGLPADGFLSVDVPSGDLTSRVLSGTANQLNVANGDGSAAPVFSLSSTLSTPGTFNIGGGGATVNTISTDTGLSSDSDTVVSTERAVKTYVDSRALNTVEFTGTATTIIPNTRYIANNASLITFTLPGTMKVGDTIEIWGKGAGLFKIAQQASQVVHVGPIATLVGVGGSITSTEQYDFLRICCLTDNIQFSVLQRGVMDVI